jgi:hypothetical protein
MSLLEIFRLGHTDGVVRARWAGRARALPFGPHAKSEPPMSAIGAYDLRHGAKHARAVPYANEPPKEKHLRQMLLFLQILSSVLSRHSDLDFAPARPVS